MNPALIVALEAALARKIEATERASGGDINDAYRVTLAGGTSVFVKTNDRSPKSMFRAEANGLDWLAEARSLSIPKVLAWGKLEGETSDGNQNENTEVGYLVLEWLNRRSKVAWFDEHLGRGLALLHRYGAKTFGLHFDNFIGRLPQSNVRCDSFSKFYREQRIEPQVEMAVRQHRLDASVCRDLERLYAKFDGLLGPPEPPSRLHGDLWSGNVVVGPDGEPWLIDPAAYGGHREMDLAMMRLFGGFSERVFDSYAEAFPLQPGVAERVELMQLYPLLVHVNLFGGSYVGQVTRICARYR